VPSTHQARALHTSEIKNKFQSAELQHVDPPFHTQKK
jgi:hypothetical protein